MNFFDLLIKYAELNSDKIAIADDELEITYNKLLQLVWTNRELLVQSKMDNKTIILKISNQIKFGIAFLSLLAAGCWVIPIPADVSEDTCEKIADAYSVKHKIGLDFFLFDCSGKHDVSIQINEDECGIYQLTSGSTGVPKLCIRSLRALKEEGSTYRKMMMLQNTRMLSLAPIYHSFALGTYMASLVSASSIYLVNRFTPRRCVDIIGIWKPNVIIAVPVMIKAITNIFLTKEYSFSELAIVLVGTGIVSDELNALFKKRFGAFISTNYGSTETGGVISRFTENPLNSIGKEMPGVQIKLINKDGRLAAAGEEGEAYVKCNYMMSGYLGCSENVFDKQGYFPMGDTMTKDEQGFYYITGRTKNIINIGGKKVNPKEIENILFTYPGVRDCVVLKDFKTNGEERVKAILAGDKLDEKQIRSYLGLSLTDYKIPSVIEFRDKIARNSLGKFIEH